MAVAHICDRCQSVKRGDGVGMYRVDRLGEYCSAQCLADAAADHADEVRRHAMEMSRAGLPV